MQEYFEELHQVRGQHEWSYYSAHAMAAKVCLLLLNDPAVYNDYCAHHTTLPHAHGEGGPSTDVDDSAFSRFSDSVVLQWATDDDETAAVDAQMLFLHDIFRYAALSWAYHMKLHGEENVNPRVILLLQRFLGSMDDSGEPYRRWMRLEIHPSKPTDIGLDWRRYLRPAEKTSLAICRLGLYRVLGDWWDASFCDPNAQSTAGKTLLHLAAKARNIDIVARLINAGADMLALDDEGRNALALASQSGAEPVVRLLLDRGVDVDTPSGWYGNALQAASSYSHKPVVQLLLDRGADINAQGGAYGNALQAAASNASESVVRLLLDRGTYDMVGQGKLSNALRMAKYYGNDLTVRLLQDRGAEVDSQGGWFGDSLEASLRGGNE